LGEMLRLSSVSEKKGGKISFLDSGEVKGKEREKGGEADHSMNDGGKGKGLPPLKPKERDGASSLGKREFNAAQTKILMHRKGKKKGESAV